MKNKKLILGIVVSLVGIALFINIARQEDWGEIWRAFKQAEYWLLVPSLILLYLSLIFRAYRWRVFLHGHGEYETGELFAFTTIGFMGNSIFPARAGEFMRAFFLAKKRKVPFLTVFATVGVERLFDLVAVIAFFAVTVMIAPFPESYRGSEAEEMIRYSGLFSLVLLAVMIIALGLLTFKPDLFKRILELTVGRVLPKLKDKLVGMVDSFAQGLSCLRSGRLIFWSLFWSVLVWISIGLSEYLIFIAFTDKLGIAASFLVMSLIAFAVAAPSTPGYLGIYDVVCQSVLIKLFAVETAVATSCTLILHASQLFPVILGGVVCLWWQGLSFKELRETEKMAEHQQENDETPEEKE